MSVEEVFSRYHVGWVTKNPALIASLHSQNTVFQLHDGSAAVVGRVALRAHCIGMFEQFDFAFEMGRFFHGVDHWVFEWAMILNLVGRDGAPFTARVDMLDVVTINQDALVTRKDVYMNGAQASTAFEKAGISRERSSRTA
jgi:hypothetical protein